MSDEDAMQGRESFTMFSPLQLRLKFTSEANSGPSSSVTVSDESTEKGWVK